MATVFKAFHPALDRYMAIKVLHPALIKDDQFFERFKREARIVAKLEHPHQILALMRPVCQAVDYAHQQGLLLKALAKEPEDRFATAGELLTALEQTLREPVIAGRANTAVGKPTPTLLKRETSGHSLVGLG